MTKDEYERELFSELEDILRTPHMTAVDVHISMDMEHSPKITYTITRWVVPNGDDGHD